MPKLLLLLYIVFFTYNTHINYNNIYTNYYAESSSNSCSVFLLLVIGLILCAGRSRNITNNGMYTLLVHAMCMYSEGLFRRSNNVKQWFHQGRRQQYWVHLHLFNDTDCLHTLQHTRKLVKSTLMVELMPKRGAHGLLAN